MLFLLLFVISGDTEKQTKSCPRRYLKSPQKESLETSWEVPKTSKNVKKVVFCQNRKITKKYKNQIEKKTIQKPPSSSRDVSKTNLFTKKTLFYTSFFQTAFEVIFKHQKTSKVRLSPAREPDFHCSTKSSKYAEQAFIFDPKSNVKTNKHKYGKFQKVVNIALTTNFNKKNRTSSGAVSHEK